MESAEQRRMHNLLTPETADHNINDNDNDNDALNHYLSLSLSLSMGAPGDPMNRLTVLWGASPLTLPCDAAQDHQEQGGGRKSHARQNKINELRLNEKQNK